MKTCTVEGCDKKHASRGMCSAHYFKWRTEDLKAKGKVCSVANCGKPLFVGVYCRGHYARHQRGNLPVNTPLNPHVLPDAFVRFRLPKTAIAKLESEATRLSVTAPELLSIFVLRALGLQR